MPRQPEPFNPYPALRQELLGDLGRLRVEALLRRLRPPPGPQQAPEAPPQEAEVPPPPPEG